MTITRAQVEVEYCCTDFDLELRPDFMIRFNRKQMVRDAKVRCKKGSICCMSSGSTKLLGHLLEESLQTTCHVAVEKIKKRVVKALKLIKQRTLKGRIQNLNL